jgi:NitT/TauT family transport system ATP-binding protein
MSLASSYPEPERRPSVRPASVRPPEPRGRLELRGVEKAFGDGYSAVRAVELTCEGGEFLVIVGPSGCGKTTLLKMVAGMLKPDRGTIRLDGKPVTAPGPDRAVVFQEHGLFPWLTVEENVAFGLKMRGMDKHERRERVAKALVAVRLPDAGKKLVHELSGGMRQRVAIARALVIDPAMLLMDEPFAALDAQTRTMLHAHLQDLWCSTRKSILFITHSVGEAVRLADRVIIMGTNPGCIRKSIPIELPHPRPFDSAEVNELGGHIRSEIAREVHRDDD